MAQARASGADLRLTFHLERDFLVLSARSRVIERDLNGGHEEPVAAAQAANNKAQREGRLRELLREKSPSRVLQVCAQRNFDPRGAGRVVLRGHVADRVLRGEVVIQVQVHRLNREAGLVEISDRARREVWHVDGAVQRVGRGLSRDRASVRDEFARLIGGGVIVAGERERSADEGAELDVEFHRGRQHPTVDDSLGRQIQELLLHRERLLGRADRELVMSFDRRAGAAASDHGRRADDANHGSGDMLGDHDVDVVLVVIERGQSAEVADDIAVSREISRGAGQFPGAGVVVQVDSRRGFDIPGVEHDRSHERLESRLFRKLELQVAADREAGHDLSRGHAIGADLLRLDRLGRAGQRLGSEASRSEISAVRRDSVAGLLDVGDADLIGRRNNYLLGATSGTWVQALPEQIKDTFC